jgi:hypothetical protein
MDPHEICVIVWPSGRCNGEDPLLEWVRGEWEGNEVGDWEECCGYAEFAGISPDGADGHDSGDGAPLSGGLLVGDLLMTLPFVPPNAERSWILSGCVSGGGI